MHIPSITSTTVLDIVPFETALKEALAPSKAYDVAKWLYVPNTYDEYRYILGTRGQKPLICIGINPSTAEPDNLDNTLKSVERIAHFNGFDSFIMFNLYAQRATQPDDMEKTLNRAMHEQNMKAFEYVLSLSKSSKPAVWAAWGAIIEKRGYLFECAADMVSLGEKYEASWFTAGKRSVKGHPHHPLYLSKSSVLKAFDANEYCKQALTLYHL